jgi:Arc/MetJ family transcription regulator
MRTNIVIDDELISKAISLSENKTKKAVVEEALRLLVQFKEQLKIKELRGKLKWEGDLNKMRTNP